MTLVQKNVQLNKDDTDWFSEQYPHANLSGILGLLLSRFRMAHATEPLMVIEQTAKDVKEEIE